MVDDLCGVLYDCQCAIRVGEKTRTSEFDRFD